MFLPGSEASLHTNVPAATPWFCWVELPVPVLSTQHEGQLAKGNRCVTFDYSPMLEAPFLRTDTVVGACAITA